MSKEPSFTQRLSSASKPSTEVTILNRNLSYGSAAACLVILIGVLQVRAQEREIPLQISVFSASVGMPLWLLIGMLHEIHILLGVRSHDYTNLNATRNFIGFLYLVSGLSVTLSAGGVIWFLLPDAAFVFAAACVACLFIGCIYYELMARWWFGPRGPGASEVTTTKTQTSPEP